MLQSHQTGWVDLRHAWGPVCCNLSRRGGLTYATPEVLEVPTADLFSSIDLVEACPLGFPSEEVMIRKSTPRKDHNRGDQVNFVKFTQNNWPNGWEATSRWTYENCPFLTTHSARAGQALGRRLQPKLIRHQLEGSCRSCSALGPRNTSRLLGHGYPKHRVLPHGHPDSWSPLLAGLLK